MCSSLRNVQILSHQEASDTSQRCTSILNGLERFMTNNLIEMFGCDYSSSGINMSFIGSKLKTFFSRRTNDGRRYDTYFFYFSGPTNDHGDLTLAGKSIIAVSVFVIQLE